VDDRDGHFQQLFLAHTDTISGERRLETASPRENTPYAVAQALLSAECTR